MIRDHSGTFVAGFAKPIQHVVGAYHDQVELFAIKEALIFLSSLLRQQTLVVSDCLLAIHVIHDAKMDQSMVNHTH